MKFEQFKTEIEKAFRNKFRKSYCGCRIYDCLGKSITIDCHMAENTSECPNNISGNDMMKICLAIQLPNGWSNSDELPENLTMESWENSIKVKPSTDYLYCDCKKASYRKTKGDAKKIIIAFEKFVDRLYNLIREEYQSENLLDYDMSLIKEKRYFI